MSLAINGGKPVRKKFIPYGRHFIDRKDISAVKKVLKSPYLTSGPKVEEFEKELCQYTGAKYAVAISNGTAALHAACFAAGITKGDEVITSAITFAASANCILYCGGTPVFADINPNTFNIDPQSIKEKITKKTKAIIAVDFTGQSVEIDEIKKICKDYDLLFIQDSAHSIGTKYKGVRIGNHADLTTFSFHPVKTITSGEGGAILTNNLEYYEKLMLFRAHGITRDLNLIAKNQYIGYYEQIHLGYNYRMTDIQAALAISQLKKLDKFIKRRSEIVKIYNNAFKDIPEIIIQNEIKESETSRHLYILRFNFKKLKVDRNQIYKALHSENIGLQVHYIPVYFHPYYQELGYQKGNCPNAEILFEEMLTIPLYYSLTNYDVYTVIKAVKKIIEYYKK